MFVGGGEVFKIVNHAEVIEQEGGRTEVEGDAGSVKVFFDFCDGDVV